MNEMGPGIQVSVGPVEMVVAISRGDVHKTPEMVSPVASPPALQMATPSPGVPSASAWGFLHCPSILRAYS